MPVVRFTVRSFIVKVRLVGRRPEIQRELRERRHYYEIVRSLRGGSCVLVAFAGFHSDGSFVETGSVEELHHVID